MSRSKGWMISLGLVSCILWASPVLAGHPLEQPLVKKQGQPMGLQQQKKNMQMGGSKTIPRGNPPDFAPAKGLRQQTGSTGSVTGNQFPSGTQKKTVKRPGSSTLQNAQSQKPFQPITNQGPNRMGTQGGQWSTGR